jgi:hypothetical protein
MANFIQKGVKNILQKNPHDVVFLSAIRTPVTRAKKGGLRDAYDHEMLAAVRQSIPLPFNIVPNIFTLGPKSNNKQISKSRSREDR